MIMLGHVGEGQETTGHFDLYLSRITQGAVLKINERCLGRFQFPLARLQTPGSPVYCVTLFNKYFSALRRSHSSRNSHSLLVGPEKVKVSSDKQTVMLNEAPTKPIENSVFPKATPQLQRD